MPDTPSTPLVNFAIRHEKLLGGLALAWLALSWAASNRLLPLPQIPLLTAKNSWMISGPWNLFWWCFLYPQIVERKEALAKQEEVDAEEPPDS